MRLLARTETTPQRNEPHAQCEHEHQWTEVREQLASTGGLCLSNRAEYLVLGEIESTCCENVPSI